MRATHAPSNRDGTDAAAQVLLEAFVSYHDAFRTITRRAQSRFEACDWPAVHADAAERLALYRAHVDAAVETLGAMLPDAQSPAQWLAVKVAFATRAADRTDSEIAATEDSFPQKMSWRRLRAQTIRRGEISRL